MYYYEIALPLNVDQLFTYRCDRKLKQGCRVLVSFNNTLQTGFIWTENESFLKEKQFPVKDILEIIDNTPLLSPDLLSLAEWMSNYYLCSLGTVIMAMLPTALQIQVATEIRLLQDQSKLLSTPEDLEQNSQQQENEQRETAKNPLRTDETEKGLLSIQEKKLLSLLKEDEWTKLTTVKEQLQGFPIYKHLEKLEDQEIIEIKRTFDRKIKKKFANFIFLNEVSEENRELTAKQQEAWNRIRVLAGDDQPLGLQKRERSRLLTPGKLLPLARVADDYSYSVIKALRNKGLISIEAREVTDTLLKERKPQAAANLILSEEQDSAFRIIRKELINHSFKTFLLYGVTGSGKTEIYLRLIKECLAQSRSALILVPEIALTPQMEERFYNAFGEKIAVLHSHRNERERWEEWKRIRKGDCRIVLGARSALFAPLARIGLIIVDEEHEGSYKQDNNPRYNARDLAVFRGKQNNAVVVLGSATPSLESWANAQNKRYELLQLTHRPLRIPMPEVTIIDMKEEQGEDLLSALLKEKILERLARKEQIILFQNRRGYASYVICLGCGTIHRCPKCDVSLIYHSSEHLLMCHYCGYKEKMFRKCPGCGSYVLEFGTAGTQQLEKQLQILFPSARILRMDTDSTYGKESYDRMYKRMGDGTVDILFGTQMIAKGLDFANVTLVGVISADNSLNIPDFRSTERTFQLLTQVAGRSGRGDRKGEVIIQTHNPKHYAILTAQKQDFCSFVAEELTTRKALNYPPFVRIARLLFSHRDEAFLKEQLEKTKPYLHNISRFHQSKAKKSLSPGVNKSLGIFTILGPVTTPIPKINDRYRFHVIIKTDSVKHLLSAVHYLRENIKLNKAIKIDIDIDPSSLM